MRVRTALLVLALACTGPACTGAAPNPALPGALEFGDAFWKFWGDGRAELAGYDLVFPRYGELRSGTAVTVFVTETFSNSLRVKSDPGRHPRSDEFPVMKLNLVQDFQTGIYDYNLMTSAFVALTPVNGRPPGSPTKVSFSAQEWCGLVFAEAVFDRNVVRLASHSYFDGEGDLEARLAAGPETLSEDALLMWARGLCAPKLEPGGRASVTLLRSLEESRLLHSGLVTSAAKLARSARTQRVSVPAGTFEADVFTAEIAGGRTWTFHVERAAPRRVLRWQASDGRRAELLASGRFEYWKMNAEGFERQLSKLGLERRAPRTP